MRITYVWTEREWREAVSLAAGRPQRRPVLPGLTWALIILPLIGGAAELLSNLRRGSHITLAGSILPLMLLLLAAVIAGLLSIKTILRRRKHAEGRATMPAGACEAVLQETGWRFTTLPETTNPTPPRSGLLDSFPKADTIEHASGIAGVPLLRPWSEITHLRQSNDVIVLVHDDGFQAIPTSCLSQDQGGHLHRLLTRKVLTGSPSSKTTPE